ncbi:glucosamine-6-phosphate deaminase [Compostibacter hankyongensis]|uniref:Glucosamine-6-phosphate deaminase n=1 Tax=Compostibacter hankyongensis TaxID=1007089 RepID=A0ABP8FWP5_9BACT
MQIDIQETPALLGCEAGRKAASLIRKAIGEKGSAHVVLATGASQFETLKQLVREKDIAWDKVVMFHLDEYIDLPASHGASFRKYLKERFLDQVPPLKAAYLINGEHDPLAECERIGALIRQYPVDVALVGIGENGHIAFNDPPADFEIEDPYIVVDLDEQCRRQQVDEGWFSALAAVPQKAISMSVRQILKSRSIICSVPDKRKARAVKNCLEGGVSNLFPASILQRHSDCIWFLDKASVSLLAKQPGQ